jgi:hypothetical protein
MLLLLLFLEFLQLIESAQTELAQLGCIFLQNLVSQSLSKQSFCAGLVYFLTIGSDSTKCVLVSAN